MTTESNNKKKYIWPSIILLCTIIIIFFWVPRFGNFIINNYISIWNLAPVNNDGQSSSGVQVIEFTWDMIVAPSNPRDYIDYIIQNWEQWKDYFIVYPNKQPDITSSDKAVNNSTLRQYAYKYRYSVDIWNINSGVYIMFTTIKPISDNRSLFLTINWSSKWALNMNLKKDAYYDNEYLFDINEISAWWYRLDFNDYISDWKIILWWYVGESKNWITKITIVKK